METRLCVFAYGLSRALNFWGLVRHLSPSLVKQFILTQPPSTKDLDTTADFSLFKATVLVWGDVITWKTEKFPAGKTGKTS